MIIQASIQVHPRGQSSMQKST